MEPSATDKQNSNDKKQQLQQHLSAEAAKRGLSLQQYVNQLKEQAFQRHQPEENRCFEEDNKSQMQEDTSRQKQLENKILNNTSPPKEKAIAIAKFLQSQDLKTRTCILQEKRKEMFKGMIAWYCFCFLSMWRIKSWI